MIRYNEATKLFEFYVLVAKFTAHGENSHKYTNDQRYWEEFISRWWHHSNLSFETTKPSTVQLDRLNEVNTAKADPAYVMELSDYVEFGSVPAGTTSPFLKTKAGSVAATNANLERVRIGHRARLAEYRHKVEVGGFQLPSGMRLATDRQSQAMLSSAFQSLSQSISTRIDWKSASGWTSVTLQSITPLVRACNNHVQRCFSAERAVDEQMTAMTNLELLEAFDVVAAFDSALTSLNQTTTTP